MFKPRLTSILILLALCQSAAGQQQQQQQQQWFTGMSATVGGGRAESLEYRVADAEVVVLGSIQPAALGGAFVNVSVLEAFKGSAPSTVTAMYTPEQGARPMTPTPPGMQDLIFLKKVYIPRESVASSQEMVVRSHVRLDGASGVYASDFTHLADTDAIIASVRQAIAFGEPEGSGQGREEGAELATARDRNWRLPPIDRLRPEKKTAVLLFPPATPGAKVKAPPTYLAVPVDARLEALGRRWAEARDAHVRVRAAQALSHFRSKENAEILQGLLTDTATPYATGSGKWMRGVYAVREEAYRTLSNWGMQVQVPELEGPMYRYRPAYLEWLLLIPIAIAAWVLLGAAVQGPQFRFGRAFFQAMALLSVGIAAGLVVLWVRSWFVVDEMMYPAGSAHHQVASYRGGVQYLVMLDADREGDWRLPPTVREGPVYGAFELSSVEDQWGLDEQSATSRGGRAGFGFAAGRMTGPANRAHPYRVIRVPYYPLVGMAVVLPGVGIWQWWRGWRRVTRGLCRACGYDLRASRGRCPECGARELAAI